MHFGLWCSRPQLLPAATSSARLDTFELARHLSAFGLFSSHQLLQDIEARLAQRISRVYDSIFIEFISFRASSIHFNPFPAFFQPTLGLEDVQARFIGL